MTTIRSKNDRGFRSQVMRLAHALAPPAEAGRSARARRRGGPRASRWGAAGPPSDRAPVCRSRRCTGGLPGSLPPSKGSQAPEGPWRGGESQAEATLCNGGSGRQAFARVINGNAHRRRLGRSGRGPREERRPKRGGGGSVSSSTARAARTPSSPCSSAASRIEVREPGIGMT